MSGLAEKLAPEEDWRPGDVVRNADDPADGRTWAFADPFGSFQWTGPEKDQGNWWYERDELPERLTLLVRDGQPVAAAASWGMTAEEFMPYLAALQEANPVQRDELHEAQQAADRQLYGEVVTLEPPLMEYRCAERMTTVNELAADGWRLHSAPQHPQGMFVLERERPDEPAADHPRPGDVVTEEPPPVSVVADRDGATWDWTPRGWGAGLRPLPWAALLDEYGPVTLVRWGTAESTEG